MNACHPCIKPATVAACLQGAAEIVLARCTALLDAGAAEQPLSAAARADLEAYITAMAASGLRTLCLAQRRFAGGRADWPPGAFDEPPDEQLTLCCIVGIKARAPSAWSACGGGRAGAAHVRAAL